MSKNFLEPEHGSAKRFIGIGAVILLHLAIFYALLTGLNQTVEKPVEQPVELIILQDKQPEPEPPPPVVTPPEPPKLVKEVAKTPEPEQPVKKTEPIQQPVQKAQPQPATPAPPAPVAAASPSPVAAPAPAPASPAPQAAAPSGVTRGVSKGEAGCKTPDYPRDALRNEEQGSVTVSVLVGTNGQVVQSKVKRSSGSRSLDRAATSAFSLCTFKPALKDGEAQEAWYDIPYEFVLE